MYQPQLESEKRKYQILVINKLNDRVYRDLKGIMLKYEQY